MKRASATPRWQGSPPAPQYAGDEDPYVKPRDIDAVGEDDDFGSDFYADDDDAADEEAAEKA